MRARHRRPHSGLARHLNPPFGDAKRRHGGRLHVRAEGSSTKPRADRPRHRQMGGAAAGGGGLTAAQQQALAAIGAQQSGIGSANADQALTQQALNLSGSGNKRGGRVGIKRKRGGRARHLADGGSSGHWMEKAFANSHGQFKAKAKRAGKSVAAEAVAVTKPGSHASTKTKRQANLAKLGAKYGGH